MAKKYTKSAILHTNVFKRRTTKSAPHKQAKPNTATMIPTMLRNNTLPLAGDSLPGTMPSIFKIRCSEEPLKAMQNAQTRQKAAHAIWRIVFILQALHQCLLESLCIEDGVMICLKGKDRGASCIKGLDEGICAGGRHDVVILSSHDADLAANLRGI